MKQPNRNKARRKQRQEEAKVRQAARDALTPAEQVYLLYTGRLVSATCREMVRLLREKLQQGVGG